MTTKRKPRARRDRGAAAVARRPPGGWRGQLNSFGGPVVVGAFGLAVVGLVVLAIQARPISVSEAPLIGDRVVAGPASHVTDLAQIIAPVGAPPTGGPHLAQPQRPGTYEQPIPDGNAIHSLEHGMVWISYRPDLLSADELGVLKETAKTYRNDVVLSPRAANNEPVSVVSWERRMRVALPLQTELLRAFVETNRNRSPEPGIR